MISLIKSRGRGESGFSLVEVVISIGIVSIALLPIFSLLPMGLTTFHNSSELYFSSQARQKIIENLQQTDMSALLSGATTYTEKDYFDDQGTFLGTEGTTFASTPVYQVLVTVSKQTAAGQPLVLPDAGSNTIAANTVANALLVTTQFSRYNANPTANSTAGSSSYQIGTDYLYYNDDPTIK